MKDVASAERTEPATGPVEGQARDQLGDQSSDQPSDRSSDLSGDQSGNQLGTQPNDQALAPDRQRLLLWMDALEAYGRDWDETFDRRAAYFTQEFWYLLVNCMVNQWRGTPLSVSGACQQMKTGSNRTREARIQKAVADGYLIKQKSEQDHREAFVVPSPKLEALMIAHFERTLTNTIDALRDIKKQR